MRRREGEYNKVRGSLYLNLGFSEALRHSILSGSRLQFSVFRFSPLMSAQHESNVCSKATQIVHLGFGKRCQSQKSTSPHTRSEAIWLKVLYCTGSKTRYHKAEKGIPEQQHSIRCPKRTPRPHRCHVLSQVSKDRFSSTRRGPKVDSPIFTTFENWTDFSAALCRSSIEKIFKPDSLI